MRGTAAGRGARERVRRCQGGTVVATKSRRIAGCRPPARAVYPAIPDVEVRYDFSYSLTVSASQARPARRVVFSGLPTHSG